MDSTIESHTLEKYWIWLNENVPSHLLNGFVSIHGVRNTVRFRYFCILLFFVERDSLNDFVNSFARDRIDYYGMFEGSVLKVVSHLKTKDGGYYYSNYRYLSEYITRLRVLTFLRDTPEVVAIPSIIYPSDRGLIEELEDGEDEHELVDDCYDDMNERNPKRFDGRNPYISSSFGEIIGSQRPVGVELEITYNSENNRNKASHLINEDYGCVTDGSVNNYSLEIVSPIMNAVSVEKTIREVCQVVKDTGGAVDKSTGFHVHIDMSELRVMNQSQRLNVIKNLIIFYTIFEDIMYSFLPKSRHNAQYCYSLRGRLNPKQIENAKTEGSLMRLWYETRTIRQAELRKDARSKYDSSRYHSVNFHTLFKEYHHEIRCHNGTKNPEKILHWVNLHTKIADYIMKNRLYTIDYKYNMSRGDLYAKTLAMFDIIGLQQHSVDYFMERQVFFLRKYHKGVSSVEQNTTVEDNMESSEE